jgi:hypothetical protein
MKIPATLTLPDGVILSRTALICSRELKEWKQLGRTLQQSESSIQWWLGDWWHYGNHRYGERKATVKAKDIFGYAFSTLMNFGSVAGRVQTSRRREDLAWSHHEVVARLKPEEQEYYLDIAVKNRLSVRDLRDKLKDDDFINHPVHNNP